MRDGMNGEPFQDRSDAGSTQPACNITARRMYGRIDNSGPHTDASKVGMCWPPVANSASRTVSPMPDWALVSLQSMSPPGGKDIRRPGGDLPT